MDQMRQYSLLRPHETIFDVVGYLELNVSHKGPDSQLTKPQLERLWALVCECGQVAKGVLELQMDNNPLIFWRRERLPWGAESKDGRGAKGSLSTWTELRPVCCRPREDSRYQPFAVLWKLEGIFITLNLV